jgi:RNA-binding protein 5/10
MELYGPSESNSITAPAGSATPLKTTGQLGGGPSFIDREKKCCYLCERRFKNEQTLLAHERKSELHLTNLQKPDLKAKAMAKLRDTTENITEPEYRDRAKERRQQQSKSPAPTTTSASSIGQTLLTRMGWSAGQGLGAQGTGRVAAIETQMYAQGVGLGAQGGKIGDAAHEANKNTHRDEYRAYVDMVKEKAKERYNSMN